jgi:hypothetical protein
MHQIKLSTNKLGLVISWEQLDDVTMTKSAKALLIKKQGELLSLLRLVGPEYAGQVIAALSEKR